MAQTKDESLMALEHLMEEFFSASASNARKHEIEQQLAAFSQQKDAWKHCVHFLTHTSSQYVSMYSLSTIESVINREWTMLDAEASNQLQNTLYTFLVEHNSSIPNFLRNKLAKVMVDIARHDWPDYYPEYFTNILQLLQSEQGQLLGLVLLRTTSEELMSASSCADMNSARKEQLGRLMRQHVPAAFHCLAGILEALNARPRHRVTATPPPSPTQPEQAPEPAPQLTTASFRRSCSREITRELLAVLQHMFSWVDLVDVNPALFRGIFHLTNTSSFTQEDDEMCVLAMSALNELLYRKCAPPESHNLFVQLYSHSVKLLQEIILNSNGRIDHLSPEFVEKLTEFLTLFVSQHLWRLESRPRFSAMDFLSVLFECTFHQSNILSFLQFLDVWREFIKQLKKENAYKYDEALISLINAVLNKMQFQINQAELEEANDDIVDDDNETEWRKFLKECIEIISLVAELHQTGIFTRVLDPWQKVNESFRLIEQRVNSELRELTIAQHEIQGLHCVLKDLSTLTQALARLSSLFMDESAQTIDNYHISKLISDMIDSALYASRCRFDRLSLPNRVLAVDFIDAHAQLLAGIKTWSFWITLTKANVNHSLLDVVNCTISILLNGSQEPGKLSHSAAHLLLSLTNIVPPSTLITMPSMVELLHLAPGIRYQDEHTVSIVHQSVCNLLIRSWGDVNEAEQAHRLHLLRSFFDTLTKNFRELTTTTNEAVARLVVAASLPAVSQIVDYCKHHSSSSKKLLHIGIEPVLNHALTLLPNYSSCSEINNDILELFLTVLNVLIQNFSLEFTQAAVQVFLNVAITEQRARRMSGLDKLLRILQLVVEGPGQMYKTFLPGIIALCLEHVYPLVACELNEHPDVICALLSLLHSILLHRWQYFYLSQVRLGYSPGASDLSVATEAESLQNREQLLSILQIFGQALLQSDINVFRLSLASLENLNTKWKLYHKALFKEHLLSQFLTVLLQTLLHKSQGLLVDDIVQAVFNMSSVDLDCFFGTFLAHFTQTIDGLDEGQKKTLLHNFMRDTDMPTFILNVQRYINDMRFHRLCNASLPADSVILH